MMKIRERGSFRNYDFESENTLLQWLRWGLNRIIEGFNMSTITDSDLKDLRDLINSKFEQIDRKFERVFDELTTIKVDIATLKEGQKSIDKRLDETKEALSQRLDSVETRLNTVTLGVFGIIGVLVTGLLTFVGKVVFFPNI